LASARKGSRRPQQACCGHGEAGCRRPASDLQIATCDTAGELRQTLLEFLAIVVGGDLLLHAHRRECVGGPIKLIADALLPPGDGYDLPARQEDRDSIVPMRRGAPRPLARLVVAGAAALRVA
jgi:hypothetical protein